MKLSKSLLQAILVSVTIGAASSCNLVEELTDEDLHQCDTNCEKLGIHGVPVHNNVAMPEGNCPTCGMG